MKKLVVLALASLSLTACGTNKVDHLVCYDQFDGLFDYHGQCREFDSIPEDEQAEMLDAMVDAISKGHGISQQQAREEVINYVGISEE